MTSVLERRQLCEDRRMREATQQLRQRLMWCRYKPRNPMGASWHQKIGEGAWDGFPPRAPRRNQACRHRDFGVCFALLSCFFFFLSTMKWWVLRQHGLGVAQFAVFCFSSPGKQIQLLPVFPATLRVGNGPAASASPGCSLKRRLLGPTQTSWIRVCV